MSYPQWQSLYVYVYERTLLYSGRVVRIAFSVAFFGVLIHEKTSDSESLDCDSITLDSSFCY